MPYNSRHSLPDPVRDHLPPVAQSIYLHAYNRAWYENSTTENYHLEENAHDAAWAVIKKNYRRTSDGNWVRKH